MVSVWDHSIRVLSSSWKRAPANGGLFPIDHAASFFDSPLESSRIRAVRRHVYNLPQKLVAEFIGTFTLVFIGAGSICADQYLTATGQSGLGLLGIAVASGLAFGVMVTALGHISGGHFNPAITIGLLGHSAFEHACTASPTGSRSCLARQPQPPI